MEPGVLFPSIIIRRTERYGEAIRHGSSGTIDHALEPPPPYTTPSPAAPTGWGHVRAIAHKVYNWVPIKEVTTMAVGSAAVGSQLPSLSTKDLFSPGIGLAGSGVVNTASSVATALRSAAPPSPTFDEAATLAAWRHHQLLEQLRKNQVEISARFEELRAQQAVLQARTGEGAIRPGGPARAGAAAGESALGARQGKGEDGAIAHYRRDGADAHCGRFFGAVANFNTQGNLRSLRIALTVVIVIVSEKAVYNGQRT
ncbi:hypothetical protein HDU85_006053 [Gaertneriomyces sp. JEL0708]|nr:hypothetical protein HDU85_006053 [Gaertneriomyces sp. JEL0708]